MARPLQRWQEQETDKPYHVQYFVIPNIGHQIKKSVSYRHFIIAIPALHDENETDQDKTKQNAAQAHIAITGSKVKRKKGSLQECSFDVRSPW